MKDTIYREPKEIAELMLCPDMAILPENEPISGWALAAQLMTGEEKDEWRVLYDEYGQCIGIKKEIYPSYGRFEVVGVVLFNYTYTLRNGEIVEVEG